MGDPSCRCCGHTDRSDPVPGLVFRTVRLDRDVDLHAFIGSGSGSVIFHRDGFGITGRGVALRGAPEPIMEALCNARSAAGTDQDAPVPLALGARPFSADEPWDLTVPALTVVRNASGPCWAILVTTGLDEPPDPTELVDDVLARAAMREPAQSPRSVEFTDVPTTDQWCAAVAEATHAIRAGQLDKVVLARSVEARADVDFPLGEILGRLRDGYPGAYVFSVDGMVGASPELLVARDGDVVRSQPMAGSTPITGDDDVDRGRVAALMRSATYRHEHQVTIDYVHETLLEFCSYIDDEPEPTVVQLPNVAHLATTVEGRLSQPPASVLELCWALHPTPAVCGRPTQAAADLIARLEAVPRDRYAGAVGWVDGHGNGEWAVTLRCASIDGSVARMHAGCGLVADSDPAAELVESTAKLQVMRKALLGDIEVAP